MTIASVPRRWMEAAVAIVLLGAIGLLVTMTSIAERRLHHQRALFFELQILRSSINLYKVVNRQNPPSLIALATAVYEMPGDLAAHRYLEATPMDPDGIVRDPFGAPYQYSVETGWIRSNSKGYEFW